MSYDRRRVPLEDVLLYLLFSHNLAAPEDDDYPADDLHVGEESAGQLWGRGP